MIRSLLVATMAGIAIVAFSASPATAAVLTLSLDEGDYGASPPTGTGPWLTAKFTDNMNGTVGLQLTANLQSATEFFKVIGFNYSGPQVLSAALPNSSVTFGFNPSGLQGEVGSFTFGFEPDTSNSPQADRFEGADVLNFVLSSTGGAINVSMFNVANSDGFFAAAHVNGIGTSSGKIGDTTPQNPEGPELQDLNAPEPASLALLALGSIGLGGFGFRRRKAKAV